MLMLIYPLFNTKYDDDVLWERKAKLFDVYFRSILPWEKMSTIYFLQQQKVYKAISR